jgi:vancomycin resistance protein YoaR
MTTDQPTSATRSRFSFVRMIGSLAVTVVLVAALATGFLFGIAQLSAAQPLPGVSVAGVPVGSSERSTAEARLRAELPSLSAGKVVLVHGDQTETIPYSQIGRDYDYQAMLDQAIAFGRSGTPVEVALDEIRALTRGHDIGVLARYDRAAIEAAVAALATRFEVVATDASVERGPGGAFVVVPAVGGRLVDQVALTGTIVQAVATTDPADVTVDVPVSSPEPSITTPEAESAKALAESMTASGLTLTTPDGKSTFKVSAATLRSWVAFTATADGGLRPTFVTAAARAAVEKYAPKVKKAPKDATFLVGKGVAVGVVAGVDGQELDPDATLQAIETALQAPAGSPRSVPLAVTTVKPKLTTEEARKTAPLMQPLGQKAPDGKYGWTVHYEVSERNFWSKNITIPARKLNGYVVEPGAIFRFWDAIGEVSRAAGYGAGGAIINGHSQPTGALAGGICSCSTTLFKAAARAGLEILERHNHFYWIARYAPEGLDATVSKTDSGGGQNMVFRNDTAYPIVIRSSASPGVVHFEIWGVRDGRTVWFSKPHISNYRRAGDKVEYTTDLAPGKSKRIEWPANGFDVWVQRLVKDKDGKVIHDDKWYSHYATVTGVTLVGKAKAEPTPEPPAPTEPPLPTEPPVPTEPPPTGG